MGAAPEHGAPSCSQVGLSVELDDSLQAIARAGRTRNLRPVEALDGCRVKVGDRQAISFASCDYLGLARHPRLAEASAEAAQRVGTSSGSARLLAGHDESVAALETELAAAFGSPAALTFSSGYLANLGVVTALAGPGDRILSDRLSHASTVDACRLTGADVRVLPHGDAAALTRALGESHDGRTLVLVEGVYSMDGDNPPLAEVVAAAAGRNANVVVDDAHGLGAIGPEGRGAAAAAGVADRVAVQVGNLGKALGSFGGFVLCDERTREHFVQSSRAFIYTCALPPTVVAAARAALAVRAEEPWRTTRLQQNAQALRDALRARGLAVPEGVSPIVPVTVGGDERAVTVSAQLLEAGFFVPAVRPPTVPEGTSRLRLTVTAEHGVDECAAVADAVAEALS